MDPLSRKKRFTYLISFAVLFAVCIPFLILYAIGYQFNSIKGVVTTGGIYVNTNTSGADVSLNGRFQKTTNIFQHNFLIGNLDPGTYVISVSKPGFMTWSKKLQVFGEEVTDIYALLLPTKIPTTNIARYLLPDGSPAVASTSAELRSIKNKTENPVYTRVAALFATTTNYAALLPVRSGLATTTNLAVKHKMALWTQGLNLHVRWLGNIDDMPQYFCVDQKCESELVFPVGSKISHVDLFPISDRFVLLTLPQGVFIYEIDAFSVGSSGMPLVLGKGVDFRIGLDGDIYTKVGLAYYSLTI